jgi:hypothetical protein
MLMALPTKSSMSCFFFARNGFEDILMQIRVEAGEAHELLNAQVRSGRREEEAKTPLRSWVRPSDFDNFKMQVSLMMLPSCAQRSSKSRRPRGAVPSQILPAAFL